VSKEEIPGRSLSKLVVSKEGKAENAFKWHMFLEVSG